MAAVQKLFPYTPKAPIRQGIYSQAVVVDRTVYISGQLGLDVASGKLVEGGVQAQARQQLDVVMTMSSRQPCCWQTLMTLSTSTMCIRHFSSKTSLPELPTRLLPSPEVVWWRSRLWLFWDPSLSPD
ncbi:2-iminobutanoate/2-iminopropanoate deaminase isoform X4 [Salvelinus alpinus]|uniref:2-iminobutanoate/2-iminopropanoate deaminase isoform X4 n=1 Tax=Salvelinus alpinus TaxID=8036 RepID=UPI0039FC5C79